MSSQPIEPLDEELLRKAVRTALRLVRTEDAIVAALARALRRTEPEEQARFVATVESASLELDQSSGVERRQFIPWGEIAGWLNDNTADRGLLDDLRHLLPETTADL